MILDGILEKIISDIDVTCQVKVFITGPQENIVNNLEDWAWQMIAVGINDIVLPLVGAE